ncbi:MAG TPA: hypothetical protein VFC02_09770 [Anaerolineales bacterium]|nr:hypothetical protein [Anaerolineales bacterium]
MEGLYLYVVYSYRKLPLSLEMYSFFHHMEEAANAYHKWQHDSNIQNSKHDGYFYNTVAVRITIPTGYAEVIALPVPDPRDLKLLIDRKYSTDQH